MRSNGSKNNLGKVSWYLLRKYSRNVVVWFSKNKIQTKKGVFTFFLHYFSLKSSISSFIENELMLTKNVSFRNIF